MVAPEEPTVVLGFSLSFGGGKSDTGVGIRLFSDNRANSFAGTVGLDCMFGTQSWRRTVGAGYPSGQGYLGFDLGIGLQGGGLDFGIGAGGLIGRDLADGGAVEDMRRPRA